MGLRINEGIDLDRYTRLLGEKLDESKLIHLRDIGMVISENSRLRATNKGRLVLNSVIEHLMPDT